MTINRDTGPNVPPDGREAQEKGEAAGNNVPPWRGRWLARWGCITIRSIVTPVAEIRQVTVETPGKPGRRVAEIRQAPLMAGATRCASSSATTDNQHGGSGGELPTLGSPDH